MAAHVQTVVLYNTTAGNKTANITPAVNGLLVAVAGVTGTATPPTSVTDNQGGTYTLIASMLRSGSGTPHGVYVRDTLVSSAVAHAVLMTSPGGDTGGGLSVTEFSGMTNTGSAAARSWGNVNNQAAGGTPAVTLSGGSGGPALTTNPLIAFVSAAANPPAVTPPSGFIERQDVGFNTPTSGIEVATADSGITASTITWGSTSGGAFGAVVVELDASAGGGPTTHFGASTATVVFTGTTAATKKTFAVSTATIVFTGTTAARAKRFGVSTGTLVFTGTTVARRKALGVSSGTIVFTATSAGAVSGVVKFGASTATITFNGTTAARKKTFGVSTGTIAFNGTTVARRKTFGVSTGTIVFNGTTVARKKTFAVSTGRVTFTATTVGAVEAPTTFVFMPFTSRNGGRISSAPGERQLTSATGGRMGVTDG